MQISSIFSSSPLWSFYRLSSYLGTNQILNSSHHLLRVTVSFHEFFLEQLLVWWWNGSDLSVMKSFYPWNPNKQLQKVDKGLILITALYTVLSITSVVGFHLSSVFFVPVAFILLTCCAPTAPLTLKMSANEFEKKSATYFKFKIWVQHRLKSVWCMHCAKIPSQNRFQNSLVLSSFNFKS